MIITLRNNDCNDEYFRATYNPVIEGLSGKGFFGVYWTILIIFKWNLTSAIMVFMAGSFSFQIMFCLVLSVIT